ncbi:MAG: efflux RND transporter periplasmic adaptor subunit [bacterium]|nr:efflux RND transporter periplasmic adaptor subunit [bacterium]
MKRNLIIIFCIIFLSVSCKNGKQKENMDTGLASEKTKHIPVFAGNMEKGSIRNIISASGNVKGIAEANIIAKVSGEVKEILVEEGDKVSKDQVLLKIDDFNAKKEKEGAEALLIGATARYEYEQQTAEKRISTQLKDAEANLKTAKANLEILKTGARPEELKQLEAEKNSAESLYKQAKNDYARMKGMWEEKLISPQEWEKADTQLKTSESRFNAISEQYNILVKGARKEDIDKAEAQVEKAEAAFELADIQNKGKVWYKDLKSASANLKDAQARFDVAEKALKDTEVKAPFAGSVMKKFINIGENAPKDSKVFSIADFSSVKIEVNTSENYLRYLRLKQKAEIKLDAYKNQIFTGYIVNIAPGVDEKDRTSKVEILIPNESQILRPGMFAQIEIVTEERNNTYILPPESIIERDNIKGVYIVNGDSAQFKPVKTGLITEEKVEILAGISSKDKIVIKGAINLFDSAKIEVVQ